MAILKLKQHDKEKEMDFELKYLARLSVKERFELMKRKSKEMIELLEKSGHRRTPKILKRT